MFHQLKRSSPLQAVTKIHLWEKLAWNRSIHAVMLPGKKFIPDNRPQSICLIPTDTHLLHKETSLWNQWEFRTTHRGNTKIRLGATFHFGTKYLYQNDRTTHVLGFISSYRQFKTINFWWNIYLKVMKRLFCFIVGVVHIFGIKAVPGNRRMLAINWSCFLEGTHFAITPIQPKFSVNQERVEFLVFTFYCLKIAIALQVL